MNQQRGVAMFFVLMILLVLTLLGVSMVQQNKQQFMMAGNVRTQVEALSQAENILTLAEDWVKMDRQNTLMDSDQCWVDGSDKFVRLAEGANIALGINDAVASIERCQFQPASLPSGILPPVEECSDANISRLGSELYTVRVTFTDDGGAVRTVESLYAIECTALCQPGDPCPG